MYSARRGEAAYWATGCFGVEAGQAASKIRPAAPGMGLRVGCGKGRWFRGMFAMMKPVESV